MVRIQEPFHGAVLNRRHGQLTAAGLVVRVSGEAPLGEAVTVNGVEARRHGPGFAADVCLTEAEADITAVTVGVGGRAEHRIRVVWDRASRPRYRFSIDDNSFFLRDIAARRYGSLFDCFYLGALRDLHRRHGVKFVLNLFHTTPEEDFDLTQFPETYRGEWAAHADWLKLSFHAHAEFPDRPYQYAAPDRLAADFDRVATEILRFAGEDSWSPPTVIHWGMCPAACLPVLAERGVKVLSGFFAPSGGGGNYTGDGQTFGSSAALTYDIHYNLDTPRAEYVSRHDALKDFRSGIVFSRCDIVCNNTPPEKVVPTLEPLTQDPNTAEIMDVFTHEQYFWPFYRNHRPDHVARCEAAIRFCAEHGYEPVFFHQGFLGV